MTFALLEPDPRIGLWAVKEIAPAKHGADAMRWVDVSAVPDVVVGWVQNKDGSLGPYVAPLASAQAHQLLVVRGDCWSAIINGFTSSALGAANLYDSTDTDRENIDRAAMAAISGQKTAGWTAQIKCAPASGPADAPKAFAAHTAAQVHQVSADLHAWIEGCRLKLDGLKAKLAGAATTAEAQAITWRKS